MTHMHNTRNQPGTRFFFVGVKSARERRALRVVRLGMDDGCKHSELQQSARTAVTFHCEPVELTHALAPPTAAFYYFKYTR
jgi:hypothetical protein